MDDLKPFDAKEYMGGHYLSGSERDKDHHLNRAICVVAADVLSDPRGADAGLSSGTRTGAYAPRLPAAAGPFDCCPGQRPDLQHLCSQMTMTVHVRGDPVLLRGENERMP